MGSTEQCWAEEPLYCGDRDGFGLPWHLFGLPQKPTLPGGVSLELMGEAAVAVRGSIACHWWVLWAVTPGESKVGNFIFTSKDAQLPASHCLV